MDVLKWEGEGREIENRSSIFMFSFFGPEFWYLLLEGFSRLTRYLVIINSAGWQRNESNALRNSSGNITE